MLDSRSLVRIAHSAPQVHASDVEQRRKNVSNAFRCADANMKGQQVIVIDDVCTSGATLEACARALKQSGAMSVWGLTLAREG